MSTIGRKGLSVIIAGATGSTGSELVSRLVSHKDVDRVVALSRKDISLDRWTSAFPNLNQKDALKRLSVVVVNWDQIYADTEKLPLNLLCSVTESVKVSGEVIKENDKGVYNVSSSSLASLPKATSSMSLKSSSMYNIYESGKRRRIRHVAASNTNKNGVQAPTGFRNMYHPYEKSVSKPVYRQVNNHHDVRNHEMITTHQGLSAPIGRRTPHQFIVDTEGPSASISSAHTTILPSLGRDITPEQYLCITSIITYPYYRSIFSGHHVAINCLGTHTLLNTKKLNTVNHHYSIAFAKMVRLFNASHVTDGTLDEASSVFETMHALHGDALPLHHGWYSSNLHRDESVKNKKEDNGAVYADDHVGTDEKSHVPETRHANSGECTSWAATKCYIEKTTNIRKTASDTTNQSAYDDAKLVDVTMPAVPPLSHGGLGVYGRPRPNTVEWAEIRAACFGNAEKIVNAAKEAVLERKRIYRERESASLVTRTYVANNAACDRSIITTKSNSDLDDCPNKNMMLKQVGIALSELLDPEISTLKTESKEAIKLLQETWDLLITQSLQGRRYTRHTLNHFIQVSTMGAREDSRLGYFRSHGICDRRLLNLFDVDYSSALKHCDASPSMSPVRYLTSFLHLFTKSSESKQLQKSKTGSTMGAEELECDGKLATNTKYPRAKHGVDISIFRPGLMKRPNPRLLERFLSIFIETTPVTLLADMIVDEIISRRTELMSIHTAVDHPHTSSKCGEGISHEQSLTGAFSTNNNSKVANYPDISKSCRVCRERQLKEIINPIAAPKVAVFPASIMRDKAHRISATKGVIV